MNPITDIIFSITWVLLLVWAIRTMSRGWNAVSKSSPPPTGMWTTQVKKPVHPEMVGVEPGEELMGVTFKQQEVDTLQESLKARIEELDSEDEEDDDDGDVIVRV